MLVSKLSSTRKISEVFISSSLKLVSLTPSLRSEKLDLLVCVTLVFCMRLQKCSFLYFFLGIFLRCVQWLKTRFSLAKSEWRRTFLLFQHLLSLKEPPFPFFCWEGEPWEQELGMFPTVVTEFSLKSLDYRYWVCFNGNLIIILPFITLFIKSYLNKNEPEKVSAWQSLILPETASFCT